MIKINSNAPLFILESTNNNIYSLKDSLGKFVVLYFYPKDDTPGCTIETNDFNKLELVPNCISDNWTFLFSLQECKRYYKENNLKGLTSRYDFNNGTDWKALTLKDVNSPIGIVAWNSAFTRPINHAVYIEDMCFSLLRKHNLWSHFSLIEVYQAIYMFLANKTTKENEVVTVENDTRIQQHGFDLKTSFRKPKETK